MNISTCGAWLYFFLKIVQGGSHSLLVVFFVHSGWTLTFVWWIAWPIMFPSFLSLNTVPSQVPEIYLTQPKPSMYMLGSKWYYEVGGCLRFQAYSLFFPLPPPRIKKTLSFHRFTFCNTRIIVENGIYSSEHHPTIY